MICHELETVDKSLIFSQELNINLWMSVSLIRAILVYRDKALEITVIE